MVIANFDHSLQADIVFVIEGTAINGAYLNDMKTNYLIPTIEYFSQSSVEEREYIAENSNVNYAIVTYYAADCLPNPSSDCYGPYTSPQKLLSVLDKIEMVGGKTESHASIAEGLATALQCFDDMKPRHNTEQTNGNGGASASPGTLSTISSPQLLQKHCILVCNSPPYNLPVMETFSYAGHTAEQLAVLLQERGINLSVMSPRKIPALFKLFDKAGGDLQSSQTKNYTKDPRHLVLLKGFSLDIVDINQIEETGFISKSDTNISIVALNGASVESPASFGIVNHFKPDYLKDSATDEVGEIECVSNQTNDYNNEIVILSFDNLINEPPSPRVWELIDEIIGEAELFMKDEL